MDNAFTQFFADHVILTIAIIAFVIWMFMGKGGGGFLGSWLLRMLVICLLAVWAWIALMSYLDTAWREANAKVDNAWSATTEPVTTAMDNLKRFWDSLDPAEQLLILCKAMPKGVSQYCDMAAASLGGATTANQERVDCLNKQAQQQGGADVVLKVNELCVKYKNDRSQLENCLLEKLPGYGVDVSECLATAPGNIAKQMQQAIKPLACPPKVPGTVCDMQADSKYVQHPKYQQCLSNLVATYNGDSNGDGRRDLDASGCSAFNEQPPNPQNPPNSQKWDACMVDAIKTGLGDKDGGLLVRQCMNTERPWWDPKGWFISIWF